MPDELVRACVSGHCQNSQLARGYPVHCSRDRTRSPARPPRAGRGMRHRAGLGRSGAQAARQRDRRGTSSVSLDFRSRAHRAGRRIARPSSLRRYRILYAPRSSSRGARPGSPHTQCGALLPAFYPSRSGPPSAAISPLPAICRSIRMPESMPKMDSVLFVDPTRRRNFAASRPPPWRAQEAVSTFRWLHVTPVRSSISRMKASTSDLRA